MNMWARVGTCIAAVVISLGLYAVAVERPARRQRALEARVRALEARVQALDERWLLDQYLREAPLAGREGR